MTSLHLQPPAFGADTGMEDTMELASDAGRVGAEDIDIDLDFPQDEEQHDDYMLDDVRSNNDEQAPSVDMGMEDDTASIPQDVTFTEQPLEYQDETVNIDLPLEFAEAEDIPQIETQTETLVEEIQLAEPEHELTEQPAAQLETHDYEGQPTEEASKTQEVAEEVVPGAIATSNEASDKNIETIWDHAVYVIFEGNEMSLFPPRDSEDSLSYLLQDKGLAHSKLDALLAEIRSILASGFSSGDEITMSFDVLDLHIAEGSSFCTAYSLAEIYGIYHALLEQDDQVDHSEALWIHLHRKTSAEGRLAALKEAVAQQESLSSLGLWEAYNGPHTGQEDSGESDYDSQDQEAGAVSVLSAITEESEALPSQDENEAQDSSATLQGDSVPTITAAEETQDSTLVAAPVQASQPLSNPNDEAPLQYADEEDEEDEHGEDDEESHEEEDVEKYDEEVEAHVDDEQSEEDGDGLDDPLNADGGEHYTGMYADQENPLILFEDNFDDHAIQFSLDPEAQPDAPGDNDAFAHQPAQDSAQSDEPEVNAEPELDLGAEPEPELAGGEFIDLAGPEVTGLEDEAEDELDANHYLDDETWIKPPGQDIQDSLNSLASIQEEPVAADSITPSSPVTITNDTIGNTETLEDDGNDFLNLDYEAEEPAEQTNSPSSGLKRQRYELDEEDDNASVHSDSKRARPS